MHASKHPLLVALLAGAITLAAGCSSAPTQEMTDAQAAIADARAAVEASTSAGYSSGAAAALLAKAEAALMDGDYATAMELAKQARAADAADRAIYAAGQAIDKAAAAGADVTQAKATLAKAIAARDAADYSGAASLAKQALSESDEALAQYRAALQQQKPAKVADDSYTVMRGDHLWGIAGKAQIYGNSYQWPLIYKANLDKIHDADLIHPDQVLTITRGASASEVDAAVNHARTRGAWSIGGVESSDRAYVGR